MEIINKRKFIPEGEMMKKDKKSIRIQIEIWNSFLFIFWTYATKPTKMEAQCLSPNKRNTYFIYFVYIGVKWQMERVLFGYMGMLYNIGSFWIRSTKGLLLLTLNIANIFEK